MGFNANYDGSSGLPYHAMLTFIGTHGKHAQRHFWGLLRPQSTSSVNLMEEKRLGFKK